MTFRHYRRPWDETRGDDFDSWGTSVWYFEIGGDGYPVRQVVKYQHGPVLKYDSEHLDDEYGGLGDQALAADDFAGFEISPEEFESAWSAAAR